MVENNIEYYPHSLIEDDIIVGASFEKRHNAECNVNSYKEPDIYGEIVLGSPTCSVKRKVKNDILTQGEFKPYHFFD